MMRYRAFSAAGLQVWICLPKTWDSQNSSYCHFRHLQNTFSCGHSVNLLNCALEMLPLTYLMDIGWGQVLQNNFALVMTQRQLSLFVAFWLHSVYRSFVHYGFVSARILSSNIIFISPSLSCNMCDFSFHINVHFNALFLKPWIPLKVRT